MHKIKNPILETKLDERDSQEENKNSTNGFKIRKECENSFHESFITSWYAHLQTYPHTSVYLPDWLYWPNQSKLLKSKSIQRAQPELHTIEALLPSDPSCWAVGM